MGTSKSMILVPLFYLKFLNRVRRLWCRNFKWAALVMPAKVVSCPVLDSGIGAAKKAPKLLKDWGVIE